MSEDPHQQRIPQRDDTLHSFIDIHSEIQIQTINIMDVVTLSVFLLHTKTATIGKANSFAFDSYNITVLDSQLSDVGRGGGSK